MNYSIVIYSVYVAMRTWNYRKQFKVLSREVLNLCDVLISINITSKAMKNREASTATF